MLLADLADRGNIPVLTQSLAFLESRQKLLAHNIANLDVPGFKTRQLDPEVFQDALRRAVDTRGRNRQAALELPNTEEFRIDDAGHLQVTPVDLPAQNLLFHDQTNGRVEVLMAAVAENVVTYNLYSQMLGNSFDALKAAIRGEV